MEATRTGANYCLPEKFPGNNGHDNACHNCRQDIKQELPHKHHPLFPSGLYSGDPPPELHIYHNLHATAANNQNLSIPLHNIYHTLYVSPVQHASPYVYYNTLLSH